jgi:hypothetical protein
MPELHPEGTFPSTIIDWREPHEFHSELHRGQYSIGIRVATEHGEVWVSLAGYPAIVNALWRNRERIDPEVKVRVRHRKLENSTYLITDIFWKD